MNQRDMLEKAIKQSLSKTPKLTCRSRVIDYLYNHKIGDKLPRGREFDPFRGMQSQERWRFETEQLNFMVDNKPYRNRLSPTLLSQVTFLTYFAIHYKAPFAPDSVFDVISRLEQLKTKGSVELLKSNIPFNTQGALSRYEHHHVDVLPNSYQQMLRKNINKIINHSEFSQGANIDYDKIESEIKSKKPNAQGRMTGFWLISRKANETNYYMGLFPHSRQGGMGRLIDDEAIVRQLLESERLLAIQVREK